MKKEKSKIRFSSVSYIGHQLTSAGLKPDPEKIRAINEMPTPEDKSSLLRFLGMIQYLAKFIPNLSMIAAPLRQILKKDVLWHWEKKHEEAITKLKQIIVKEPDDVSKPVVLLVDSSGKGLGAVLLQNDLPVPYASSTLTDMQQKYTQIEKELMAIVYGCERFHYYIYGRRILVETDHKPLEAIFQKPLYQSPLQLQKMLMKLMRYDLEVKYRRGKELYIADTLSQASLDEKPIQADEEEFEVSVVLPTLTERLTQLREETSKDPVLKILPRVVHTEWPDYIKEVNKCLQPYWEFRHQISAHGGILFKGQ